MISRLLTAWCAATLALASPHAGIVQPQATPTRTRVDGSWTLTPEGGQNVGILGALARCGDDAYLTDVRGLRIRRLNLRSGAALPGWDVPVPPFSIGADCAAGRLFVAGGGGRKMLLLALDATSGAIVEQHALPPSLFPQGGLVVDGPHLVVGGLRMPDTPPSPGAAQDAATYYRGLSIAARVDPSTAAVAPAFEPFDPACHASAGQCVRATFSKVLGIPGVAWIVTQPTSDRIGLYDGARRLVRTLSVASPGFRRSGARIAIAAAAEEGLRWGTANSQVHAAYAVNGVIAVVHYLFALPKGWTFGLPVQFKVAMNVYQPDGAVVALDVPLPELAIGQDDTHLYVADYGSDGRQGEHDRASILRVAVPR